MKCFGVGVNWQRPKTKWAAICSQSVSQSVVGASAPVDDSYHNHS